MMESKAAAEQSAELDRDAIDQVLIRRLQAGDDLALNEIMEFYQGALHSYAYRFCHDADEAADLVQEAFVRVYMKRAKYKPKGKFRTWLYTITGNLCRDWIRSHKRRPLHYVEQIFDSQLSANTELEQMHKASPDPAQVMMENEKKSHTMTAIDSLPMDLRQALVLFSLEGNSQEEAGVLLGCSAKAVETRVYRAKKQLKKLLQSN
ncbi:MAG: RNA polymerase sigma factor [Verrucomicrobiales bacterium]|nr:RNA polymerase sigma factor [Verrucomicrobiales bacterium]